MDLRPFLRDLRVVGEGPTWLEMDLWLTPAGTARPEEVLGLLGLPGLIEAGGAALRRLRLDKGVTYYGLRHRYGLMGIRNGVNLKLLSLCMGHVRTQMTEYYIAEAGLTAQVQEAAWQVAYGPSR